MKFILPRILGLALIAGVASLLLAMLAKLLLGAALITGIVMVAKKGINRRRQAGMMYGQQGFGQMEQQHYGAPFYNQTSNAMPINRQQRSSGIIPIN